MKLHKLFLHAFGPFTGAALDFSGSSANTSQLHLIYGANEAGKTSALRAMADLRYGIPGQSTEAIRNSIAFVHALGAIPKLAEFSPIPGTPLFDAAAEHTPQLRKEPLLQNNSVYCSYVSGLFSKDTLQELKNESRNPHLSRAVVP